MPRRFRRHIILVAAVAGVVPLTAAHSRTLAAPATPGRRAVARRPEPRITARPAPRTTAPSAVIRFSIAGAGRVSCRLDARPARRCTVVSPPPPAVAVPILLYHEIAAPSPATPNPSLWVDPSEFSAELAWLAANGYTAVTLDQWWQAWHGGAPLPVRPVVISMDDGFDGWYWYAAPALEAHGWPGVMNLALSHLGTATRAPANPHDTPAVWKLQPWMVERLVAAGWELDSHTLTHAHLTQIGPAALAAEVGGSRAVLQQRFDVPVDVFCYPYGEYDPVVIAEVAASGYLAAVTTETGVASSARAPYRLPRITISRGDGVAGLRADLAALGLPH
jgi:peptidoglycan/xylan/chitin deacetylase (PgdA/CDA1 family)